MTHITSHTISFEQHVYFRDFSFFPPFKCYHITHNIRNVSIHSLYNFNVDSCGYQYGCHICTFNQCIQWGINFYINVFLIRKRKPSSLEIQITRGRADQCIPFEGDKRRKKSRRNGREKSAAQSTQNVKLQKCQPFHSLQISDDKPSQAHSRLGKLPVITTAKITRLTGKYARTAHMWIRKRKLSYSCTVESCWLILSHLSMVET